MNRNDLYHSFNAVDDNVLERSETAYHSKKKPLWLKWGAIAACLCLVTALAVFHHPAESPDAAGDEGCGLPSLTVMWSAQYYGDFPDVSSEYYMTVPLLNQQKLQRNSGSELRSAHFCGSLLTYVGNLYIIQYIDCLHKGEYPWSWIRVSSAEAWHCWS